MARAEPDAISLAADLACSMHSAGQLDDITLMKLLEKLIDARAMENGYAERYGLPSEQGGRRGAH